MAAVGKAPDTFPARETKESRRRRCEMETGAIILDNTSIQLAAATLITANRLHYIIIIKTTKLAEQDLLFEVILVCIISDLFKVYFFIYFVGNQVGWGKIRTHTYAIAKCHGTYFVQ